MIENIVHRQIHAGVELHAAEAGDGAPVILVHGFPELWYSWRHQLPALAGAGYRAVAIDLRGYGDSAAPSEIEAYDILAVCGDLIAVQDDLGAKQAVFVGHDWGARVVWELARLCPERVAAVVGMSVPFQPRSRVPPLELARVAFGDDFYVLWFQLLGVADRALARDVRRSLLTPEPWGPRWAENDDVAPLPFWMTEQELAVYIETFQRTGFTGALNYYRNLDRNWQLTEPIAERRIDQPALFVTGSRDPVHEWVPASLMDGWLRDLRGKVIIEGAAHWIQQERPQHVNALLLEFLEQIGY